MIFQNQNLRIEFTIKDQNGNTVDLSIYDPTNIAIKKPSGDIETVIGVFLTDGTDGIVYHDFTVNELDEIGNWYCQCSVVGVNIDYPSSIINFNVINRLVKV